MTSWVAMFGRIRRHDVFYKDIKSHSLETLANGSRALSTVFVILVLFWTKWQLMWPCDELATCYPS